MAQHYPILFSDTLPVALQKVRKGILGDFERYKHQWQCLRTSMKYEYDYDRFYAEGEHDEVFHTDRYVGKGYVWGSTHASFEVHYNKILQKVTDIYLVA